MAENPSKRVNAGKKNLPPWEGVELQRKQNVFWNQWSSGNNVGTCTIGDSEIFENKNHPTVPTHINSLSTKSAKSYNKSWQTLPQCQKVLNLTTNIDKTCHNVIYPRKLPNLTKKSAKSYNKSAKSYNKSAKSYNKYWPSLPQ